MGGIVMPERGVKVFQCCFHIQFWHERDIVFLHHLHEPFDHAVTTAIVLGARFTSLANLLVSCVVYADQLSVSRFKQDPQFFTLVAAELRSSLNTCAYHFALPRCCTYVHAPAYRAVTRVTARALSCKAVWR